MIADYIKLYYNQMDYLHMNCKRSTNIPSSARKIAYYTPFMVQSSHALVTDLSKLYVNSFTLF